MIPVILSTGSLFNFDVDTVMALAAKIGFDGVELMVDWRRETHHAPHLQKLIQRHKLPILAVRSPFTQMIVPDWPDDPIESIEQSVYLAQEVGAQIVVVHPPRRWVRLQAQLLTPHNHKKLTLPLPLAGPGKLGRWLTQQLARYQSQTEVKIAVENMPCRRVGPFQLEPHHYFKPNALTQFQYLTFDTTHVGTRHADLMAFYQKLEPRVAHIHLSNYNGDEHQLPSDGWLPLAELLADLARKQFGGLVSLELNPHSLQVQDESKLRQNLADSLAFCQKALGE